MIHQYQNNGYNIVLDVNSGCVHVVDEPGYEVIACLNRMNENQTVQTLKEESTWNQLKDELEGKYSEEELRDILDDVTELTANGQLFVVDTYEPFIGEVIKRKTVVKALCLHIAHDCNLACKYCFAESNRLFIQNGRPVCVFGADYFGLVHGKEHCFSNSERCRYDGK